MKKLNFKTKFKENIWMQYALVVIVGVVVYLTLAHLSVITESIDWLLKKLSPVIYGIVLAYLISPLVAFIEKRVLKRIKRENVRYQLANILAIIIVIVLITVLMSFLIPQLIDSLMLFVSNLNTYAAALRETLDAIAKVGAEHNFDMSILGNITDEILANILKIFSTSASRIAAGSLSFTNNALNLGLGLILTVYFLVYKNVIMREYHAVLCAVLPWKKYISVIRFISDCNRIMATYVVSDVLDAIIIGFLNSFYMTVTGTPYVVLISVVVGVLNLLPTFGPFVGAAIAGVILLFVDIHAVLPFLIFTLVLQLMDGYIIKPRLFGGALGVPGVWITLGIIVGGKFWGFLGVLLSAPAVAILGYVVDIMLFKDRKALPDEAGFAKDNAALPDGLGSDGGDPPAHTGT